MPQSVTAGSVINWGAELEDSFSFGEPMILDVLTGLFAVLVVLNAWVTWRAFRDDLSTRVQRLAQIVLVWVFPFVGALLVLHLQRRHPERSNGRYRDALDAGDDLGPSANHYGRTARDLDGPADAAPD